MSRKVVAPARRPVPRFDDSPLLGGLLPATRALLARGAVVRHASPGSALFRAGDPVRGLVVLLEGEVQVLGMRDGRQHLVHRGGPGDTLGEVPLFSGGGYPATAIATAACSYAVLSLDTIRRGMRSDPALAFLLLGRLARRVRELVERLERNTAWSVEGRLAEVLVRTLSGFCRAGTVRREGRARYRVVDPMALEALVL